MHRQLKKLLEKAIGSSEFVIAINLDIRGFSAFSKTVESPDVAMFIKRVYLTLVDDYFPNCSFFKPTGDGLLIVLPYTEDDLRATAIQTLQACRSALADFGSFTTDDPMVNFEVPRKLGIGISRGTACRISCSTKTLDYSGRVLNLASRLMDLARPSGIVIDAGFGMDLISDVAELADVFSKATVYLKGIAEAEPIEVYYTKDYCSIPPEVTKPITEVDWAEDSMSLTMKQIKQLGPRFQWALSDTPRDPSQLKIRLGHPMIVGGKKSEHYSTEYDFANYQYVQEAGKHSVILDFDALRARLEKKGVKGTWEVELLALYPKL